MKHNSIFAPQYGLNVIFQPDLQRAREPINRGQDWHRYKPPTFKSSVREGIHCECPAEFTFFTILECDPRVLDYCEQPANIEYLENGKPKSHYPDYLFEDRLYRPTFVEVKNKLSDLTDEILFRSQFLQKTLPLVGYEYELVVVSDIDEILKANCNWIYTRARGVIKTSKFERLDLFKPTLTWKAFKHHEFPLIERTILHGSLHIEWTKPISANSLISTTPFGEISWTKSI